MSPANYNQVAFNSFDSKQYAADQESNHTRNPAQQINSSSDDYGNVKVIR